MWKHLPDQVPQKNLSLQMAAACDKQGITGDGRSRPNKRGGEADPKQPGVTLWRRRETDKDGTHGQEQDRQQTTTSSEGKMSGPCAPPGAKRFNFNLAGLV